MARFPVIQRMCPYRKSLAGMFDGDICRICQRQVHDLQAMNEGERQAFLDACKEEVCVSYSLPRGSKAAALALSAAVLAMPAAAEEAAEQAQTKPVASSAPYEGIDDQNVTVLVIGAIKDSANIDYVSDSEELEVPELPVTYED